VRRLGVVLRGSYRNLPDVVARLERFATEHGLSLAYEATSLPDAPPGAARMDAHAEDVDLVLALGGDGTFLRAARLVMGRSVPLYGVNLGQLGFLTQTAERDMEAGLARILAGEFALDRRLTLKASVVADGGGDPDSFHALNDFVIHTVGAARVTPLDLAVGNGEERDEIGSFTADGIILASPTGSTAYSLSAGGPIIVPGMECVVLTAICPHSLSVRPLVVPASDRISVRPLDPSHELQLTVDGQAARRLFSGETVVVERGDHVLNLVRLPEQTFFGTMRRKLNWAARPPERG